MKTFNTAGTCRPNEHYMVDITERLEIISKMIAKGDYFCINRGRQYGKTTTLAALADYLKDDYCVFSISFEGSDDSSFQNAAAASAYFLKVLKRHSRVNGSSEAMQSLLKEAVPMGCKKIDTIDFSEIINELCTISSKPIVVLIDEVDQASNNEGFIKFLGVLRNMYLSRDKFPTFQSIILAGVYDVKNLKLKMRSDDEHQYNSPWNIAVPFDVDMSLPAHGIAGMLAEYKSEHHLDFDNVSVAQMIYDYTSGYPFLVSRLCQIIDAEGWSWDKEGVLKATHKILNERNTLFDDMIKKLDEYPPLKDTIKMILYSGKRFAYNPDEKFMQIAMMFNFVKVDSFGLSIACRLMETRLYNYILSEDKTSSIYQQGEYEKSQFIHDGYLDMKHLLERFCEHFNDIFRTAEGSMDYTFIEEQGRKQFMLYLRPIINGVGHYYVEDQTRDLTRTDLIVDYLGQQYVIEMKIWRGNAYNERGEKQLSDYLDHYHLQTGYMVSFCFNKNKQPGVNEVMVGDRRIIEAVV